MADEHINQKYGGKYQENQEEEFKVVVSGI